jgi:hypothetical protein
MNNKSHNYIILFAIIVSLIVAKPVGAQLEDNNQPVSPDILLNQEKEKNTKELKSIYDDEELKELTEPVVKDVTDPAANIDENAKPEEAPEEEVKTPTITKNNRIFEPSFSDYNYSMFFDNDDFNEYLGIIVKTEHDVFLNGVLVEDIDDESEEGKIASEKAEPIIFPYFQLISIIYHSPKQWTVITNGLLINNDNNDATKELYVSNITPNSVKLVWKPQDYRLFEATSNNSKVPEQYNIKEHFNSIKHRQIKMKSNIDFNDKLGTISFALQPNQLFYSEYVGIYEGNPKDIMPPPPAIESIEHVDPQTEVEEEIKEEIIDENLKAIEQNIPSLLKPIKDIQNDMNKNLREIMGKVNE